MYPNIFQITDLDKVITILKAGELLLYPTDTIWGLGCDPFNSDSVDRLNTLKSRPLDKKFILLVDGLDMLKKYVKIIHPRIETLLHYLNHPITIVYQNPKNLPDHLLASDGSVAIRICNLDITNQIIKNFGKPITSTSANLSQEITPKHLHQINEVILENVSGIVEYEYPIEKKQEPSVIVKYNESGELIFLRN